MVIEYEAVAELREINRRLEELCRKLDEVISVLKAMYIDGEICDA